MNNILTKVKNIQPRQIANMLMMLLQKHTITILILFAGGLIGFALLNVNDLTSDVSSEVSTNNDPVSLPAASNRIKLNEDTKNKLLALEKDTDVDVSSNIASYRRSAFSDAAEESQWVIGAATLLESYHATANTYPTKARFTAVLGELDPALPIIDDANKVVNQIGSKYTYVPENCDDSGCKGFLLTAQLSNSNYQLGETDSTKRAWINDTAQALDVYYKFENRKIYPLESNFIPTFSTFYKATFGKDFEPKDPSGIEVNAEGGQYTYRGIDCDKKGCSDYVLRTVFKDGASYYQQSR